MALFIDTPSDRVLLRNVALLGNQDTLFVDSGRSWFDRVFVAGNVDFIFEKRRELSNEEINFITKRKF